LWSDSGKCRLFAEAGNKRIELYLKDCEGFGGGTLASSYNAFPNKEQWIEASGLTDTGTQYGGTEPGPAEASFYGWEVVEQGNVEE
jgi:hypothetical protein